MFTSSVACAPQGYAGNAWASLQYPLGFRRLGFDVYWVEFLKASECQNDVGESTPFASSVNARYFRTVMERFGLLDHAALLESEGHGHVGLSLSELEKLAPEVDLLVNGSGVMRLKSILGAVRRRLYLDMDPGYTQIWQEQYGVDMNLRDHDVYVTVGSNLGNPDCPLPTCGIRWETTLPPIVIDEWTTNLTPGYTYTTIADWYGFRPVEWRGVWYGQKADEFLRLIDLPRRVSVPLELCLYIRPDEPARARLEEQGWQLVSPRHYAATPESYRDYIFTSRGEFTAVKNGYAAGRTGWFSDRSACYLAAGRPVIMQDTGIDAYVPTGTGLLTFTDIDSAAEAINQVESDYPRHATAATAFAREFLDSDLVLSRLVQLAGL